jgi:pimeloyl-ACP methyl ester carboxylesterase
VGIYLSWRHSKRFPTHKSYERLQPERRTDTVIFVHGLHGHFRNTWPRMPELLHHDLDLPRVDILLWGYRGSIFPGVRRLPDVGEALMSFARDMTPSNAQLFFVGHSMGGLVILDGLTQEAKEGRAAERPAGATRYVVLYATPLNGSSVASAIRSTVQFLPRIGYLLMNGHLQELGRGQYCERLAGEVAHRLYYPDIRPGDANSKVRVPIKAVVGKQDPVVESSSASFFIKNPGPSSFLSDNHFSVKEPVDRDDPRYRALQKPQQCG